MLRQRQKKKQLLSAEDQAKKKELQAELGDDCAFFNSPIGLVALTTPEQPADAYWKLYADSREEHLDQTGVNSAFAIKCLAYPEPGPVREMLRANQALALRFATSGRKLLGEQLEPDPELDEESNDAKKLAELETEHGDVSWYQVPGFGLVVLARPSNPASYRQFFNGLREGGETENPEELYVGFALDCVVYPSRDKVEDLLKLKPALARKMASRGDGLCGGDYEELGKD